MALDRSTFKNNSRSVVVNCMVNTLRTPRKVYLETTYESTVLHTSLEVNLPF
jgi:hypothetical protein